MRTVIWNLKKLGRNVRRKDILIPLFRLIKIVLFVFVTIMSKAFSNEVAWWLWIVFACVFFVGLYHIDRKIDHLNKQYFLTKFPILDELKFGQLITIELKSGKVLANRVFTTTLSNEILVSSDPVLNKEPEEMLNGFKKTRWINLKKVKTIKVERD
jgi:hypothetical protein